MHTLKYKLLIVSLFFLLAGCQSKKTSFSIGRDPSWYPLELQGKANAVTALTNVFAFYLEKEHSLSIKIIDTTPLQLLQGLEQGAYEAIFTSLPLTKENKEKYLFSDPFLLLGPVLVVPIDSSITSLSELSGKVVGFNAFDQSILILQQYPLILGNAYDNMPTALEDLSQGKIDAALIPSLQAQALLSHLYGGELKIASPPLNEKGLRLLTLKGHHESFIHIFNRSLKAFKEKSAYQNTLKKFNLITLGS